MLEFLCGKILSEKWLLPESIHSWISKSSDSTSDCRMLFLFLRNFFDCFSEGKLILKCLVINSLLIFRFGVSSFPILKVSFWDISKCFKKEITTFN